VLFLYGLIVGQESAANFVPANTADDILAPLFLAVCGDPVGTAGDLSKPYQERQERPALAA
jgi:hypothetical protein